MSIFRIQDHSHVQQLDQPTLDLIILLYFVKTTADTYSKLLHIGDLLIGQRACFKEAQQSGTLPIKRLNRFLQSDFAISQHVLRELPRQVKI